MIMSCLFSLSALVLRAARRIVRVVTWQTCMAHFTAVSHSHQCNAHTRLQLICG